jgi:uncharacterized repeat protein (TIGR03803 family)
MSISGISRFALGCCAGVVALAGCGGGMSLNPSAGAPSTATRVTSVERARSSVAYKVLYSFKGGSGDAANPYAPLMKFEGLLYGTTAYGGANGGGTVYSITRSGAEMLLHSFGGPGDGNTPFAGLIDVKGTLYGTTFGGGAYCSSLGGCGTVFSITPSGTEKVLHSFGGAGDGSGPLSGLIYVKGTLYGTTNEGGANGIGTVYSIAPSGTETVLYSFKGGTGDGEFPLAGLINVKGKLYGTTVYGGVNDDGTVFSITLSGKEKMRHSFNGAPVDGERPYAGLIDVNGKLYGTTDLGGVNSYGTVFSMTPSGTEVVRYSFKGGSGDGEYPYAGLVTVKGRLFGTTIQGGANGVGTIYSIARSGRREIVLHSFGGSGDGAYPYYGALIDVSDKLYGVTYSGGANGDGIVFSLKP